MMAAPASLMANATADAETCLRTDSSDILKEETAELVGEIENDEANKKATQNKMKIAHLYYGVMTGYYGLTIKKDHGGAGKEHRGEKEKKPRKKACSGWTSLEDPQEENYLKVGRLSPGRRRSAGEPAPGG